jgi:hypothetical protein
MGQNVTQKLSTPRFFFWRQCEAVLGGVVQRETAQVLACKVAQ